jgi:hypothetical protein
LIHTKGYFEVLESVKKRAEKKAKAMARMAVKVNESSVLMALASSADKQLVEALHDAMFSPPLALTAEEMTDLRLLFAEDFLHHYGFELELVRSEKVREHEEQPAPPTFGRCIKHRNPTCEECEF